MRASLTEVLACRLSIAMHADASALIACRRDNALGKDGGTAVAGALGQLTALTSLDLWWRATCSMVL